LVFGAESFFEISWELSEAFERLSESVVVVLELVEANSAIKQEKEDEEETGGNDLGAQSVHARNL
jgi:hypothetical protein